MREWRTLQGGEIVEDTPDVGMTPGKQTLTMGMHAVQRRAAGDGEQIVEPSDAEVHEIAAAGTAGSGGPLPYLDRIQQAFGHHDVAGVRAHTDGAASAASRMLGAEAYAFGDRVAFGGAPSLHTAAHEAAHVIQQRAGRVSSAVGTAGDEHERHADAVADLVTAGRSAERLLDQVAGRAGAASQRQALGAGLATRFIQRRGVPRPSVQRTSAGGVTLSNMAFAPKQIPDDGATTAQASVKYVNAKMAGPATINWSIDGTAFGSTVSATGLVTPGTDTVPITKEKVVLKVKAVDSVQAGAHTSGELILANRKVAQAKKDFATFAGTTYKKLNYNQGLNGAFDAVYNPKTKNLRIEVRVKFVFADDSPNPKAAKWNAKTKLAYTQKFMSQVRTAWSGQYQFQNIAEPKLVWKQLNPITVSVAAKVDNAAPHFTATVHKKQVGAQVVAGTADFADASATPVRNAFPNTGPAELAALQAKTPTPLVFAAGSAAIGAADQPKVAFLGTYLHAVHQPKFNLTITGHAAPDPAAVTPAQLNAAKIAANKLSRARATAVQSAIRAAGNTHHGIAVVAKGNTAGVGDKVEIASSVDPKYVNVQPVLPHEFGHMLGLGDEYTLGAKGPGTPATHYGLAKDALGQDMADTFAKVTVDAEGIMQGGRDVRPTHYVTLWAALGDAASGAAAPVPPFARADWKFVGM